MRVACTSSLLAVLLLPAIAAAQPQPVAAAPAAAAATAQPFQPPANTTPPQGAPLAAPAPAPLAPAAPAAPPAPALPVTPNARLDSLAWQQGYLQARERLISGDFATAASLFDQLARNAPNASYQMLAFEQSRLAREWASRQMVLVPRADLGESAIHAKAVDRATSDELAVLYTDSVLFGLGTGAWASVLTDADSAAGVILPALALGAGSAGVVAGIDHAYPFRYGVPQSIVTGMVLGFEEGLLWTYWNQARVRYDQEWEPKTMTSVIWGFSAAGALTGGVVGTVSGTTPGRAAFVGSASLWSAAVGGLFTSAASDLDDNSADDKILLASIIGLNAGAIGGMLAAGPVSPTIARVRYLDLGGVSGALLFGGLYIAGADNNSDAQSAFGITALGMVVGLGTAWYLTANMPQDRREGKPALPAVNWAPTILPLRSGAGLGLQGTF